MGGVASGKVSNSGLCQWYFGGSSIVARLTIQSSLWLKIRGRPGLAEFTDVGLVPVTPSTWLH